MEDDSMSQSNFSALKHVARTLACGALVAAATFSFATPASAAEEAPACANVDVALTADNADTIRAAVLCLTNADRTERGMPALRENAKLRKAALGHSTDMVSGGYFAHTEPDGDTLVDRIVSAGYVRKSDGWSLGENLAWGTGDLGTARGVHDAWMNSSGHKANILKASYREIGIGIGIGVPSDAGAGATFTTDFGVKL
jgi:uncharacterized protein YkwD